MKHEQSAAHRTPGGASSDHHSGASSDHHSHRMDQTGHTTVAGWTAEDSVAVEAAVAALRSEPEQGYFAVVSRGEGRAEQVSDLPPDEPLVILRKPIAGG
jgi:hypothetical protein